MLVAVPKQPSSFILATLYLLVLSLILSSQAYFMSQNYDASKVFDINTCKSVEGFTDELREEIHSKSAAIDKLIELVMNGKEKHSAYNDLAYFCDTFGPRMSGSKSLSMAIEYMKNKMEKESNLSVKLESVMVPNWKIGAQWAEIVKPVKHSMNILALGTSVGTGNRTLEAQVELVHSFDELDKLGSIGAIKGKIVVFNYNFTKYAESVKYRKTGASRAAKYGAVAALVRSVTPYSIYSPHAGMGSKSIPTAAITLEDADLIQRWINRDEQVVIRIFIDAQNYDDVESFNTIGDIKGTEKPEEIVLVSGHIDSWYNTDGAMDDGGGMMISYKALDLLSKLNLTAKRTIRVALWTTEEFGLIGAEQYLKDHEHELKNFKMLMESDLGVANPSGLSYINMEPLGRCIVSEILSLTKRIETTTLDSNYEGSDIEVFTDKGLPGMSLRIDDSKYFWYHHTSGDSITMMNADDLDRAAVLWAATSYVIADLSIDVK